MRDKVINPFLSALHFQSTFFFSPLKGLVSEIFSINVDDTQTDRHVN